MSLIKFFKFLISSNSALIKFKNFLLISFLSKFNSPNFTSFLLISYWKNCKKSFWHKLLPFPSLLNCLINNCNNSFSIFILFLDKYSSKSFELINPEDNVSISLKSEIGANPLIFNSEIL